MILTTEPRALPILHRIPRWVNSWYDTGSLFRVVHFALWTGWEGRDYNHARNIEARFFSPTGFSRLGWIANYTAHIGASIPVVRIVTPSSGDIGTDLVYVAKTRGGLYYNETTPVAYINDRYTIEFKNLTTVRFAVTPASGFIDLNQLYLLHPRIEDSPIVLENMYGDQIVVDPTSPDISSDGRLYVSFATDYYLYYQSETIYDQFIAGTAYLTIDSNSITIHPKDFQNVIDYWAWERGLTRLPGETNQSLVAKNQRLGFLSKEAIGISAMLGTCQVFSWDIDSSTVLAGSGFTHLQTNLNKFFFTKETLYKDNDYTYLLKTTPTGPISLTIKGFKIDPTMYSVTNNVVTILASSLQGAAYGQVEAYYRVDNYTTSSTGNYLSNFTAGNNSPNLTYALVSTKVLIKPRIKRVKEWRWDKVLLDVEESASFDTS